MDEEASESPPPAHPLGRRGRSLPPGPDANGADEAYGCSSRGLGPVLASASTTSARRGSPPARAMLAATRWALARYWGSPITLRTAAPIAPDDGVSVLRRRPTPDQATRAATSGLSSWPLLDTS